MLLHLTNFSLVVGSTLLFDSVNVHLVPGQRVALVGPNGCGKSTLLRVLATQATPDYSALTSGQVGGFSSSADGGALLVEQDSLSWSKLLGGGEFEEDELRQMTLPDTLALEATDSAIECAEAWRRLNVAASESLGWRTAGYDTVPLAHLSPGSAVRAYLAIALHRPNIRLLLLDEPTNHLDLPSILWLQKSIVASHKTVVVVSHDAAFMDAVCDHVWAIDSFKKSITVSAASYSDFRRAEQLAIEHQAAAHELQQQRHKRLTVAADKLKEASTAGTYYTRSDSNKLQMQFMRDRAGRTGARAGAIDKLRDSLPQVEAVHTHVPLKIEIDPPAAGVSSSVMMESVVLGYDGVALPLPPVSLRIDFGEHVALVGFNGVGKSTLLKTLMGTLEPLSGRVTISRELRIGNLMQEHENLPRDKTLRQHFSQATGLSLLKTCTTLIHYGLTLQQVDSPISELNPGARARAVIAGFSMRRVNFLVLDEPSNHLDEEAVKEVLATLQVFQGTVLVVTHNREFLSSLEFTRMMLLSSAGLKVIGSVDEFVGEIEEAADFVVASTK